MANQTAKWILAAALTTLPGTGSIPAQEVTRQDATGILTSRLSSKQMKTWKAIENIALRRDQSGQPLHPTLYSLLQAAQESGRQIYIEMNARRSDNPYFAGEFAVEKLDPQGNIVSAVIRLFPEVIDTASTSENARRANGFIPYMGLGKVERYAETLGHELQHALLAVQDPGYAHLSQEQVKVKADFYRSWRLDLRWENNKKEMEERQNRLHDLSIRLEELPERTEAKIWQELAKGRNAAQSL
jgi:hypothetical protein